MYQSNISFLRSRPFLVMFLSCLLVFNIVSNAKDKNPVLSEKDKLNFTFAFFEGQRNKMLGNFSEAEEYFKRCIKIDPNSAVAFYELANLRSFQKDFQGGLKLAGETVRLSPENIWYNLLLIRLYTNFKMYAEAADTYKALIKVYPDRNDIHFDYASILALAGNSKSALSEFNKMEKKIGITEAVSLEKEKIYAGMDKPEKAVEEILSLVEAFPTEVRYYGMLAEAYVSMKDYDNALVCYKHLLEMDPENGIAHLSLSDYYRIMGDTEKSFEELKLAFQSIDVRIEFKINLMVDYFNYPQFPANVEDKVFDLLNIMLETHPDDPKSHTMLADYLIKKKQLDRARDELRLVTQTIKDKYYIWEQLLILENDLKNYTGMYNASAEAITYFPNQPNLYIMNGIAATKLKFYNEAINSLNIGLDYCLNNKALLVQFYVNLGEAYYKNNMYSSSDSVFDLCLVIDGDNKFVLNNYSYYLSIRNEKLENAEKMSKKCVELEPQNGTYLDTYAWVLYKRGKYKPALEAIEKSLDNGGKSSAVIIEHYGDILYKSERTEEAVEQWKKANAIGKGSVFLLEKIEKNKLVE